jgi:hypothetical protein
MSTYGQICYGPIFDEDMEFPWTAPQWDADHTAWWRDVNGYESLESPYTEEGAHKPGYSSDDPRINEYYVHRRGWMEANPFPVEIVEYSGFDDSMVILAIPSTLMSCKAGDPKQFTPASLTITTEEVMALIHFCSRWGIESRLENFRWWLSCYPN